MSVSVPIIRRVERTRAIPYARSLELGSPKDTFFGDQEFFEYDREFNHENIGETGTTYPVSGSWGTITDALGIASGPSPTQDYIGAGCSPGYFRGSCLATNRIESDPAGTGCIKCVPLGEPVLAGPFLGTGGTPTAPGETPPSNPFQDIINAIGGAAGGIGKAFPVGTAGTRVVQGEGGGRSPLATILLLLGIGGIGYYLYKRYKR